MTSARTFFGEEVGVRVPEVAPVREPQVAQLVVADRLAQQVEVANDVGSAHVLGNPLATAQAEVWERRVLVVERPVLVVLVREVRHRGEEGVELVLALEAVQRIRVADPARIEADDVEAAVEVVVQELAEAAQSEPHAGPAGTAGVDENAPDPVGGVARRHAGEQDRRLLSPGRVVVERHLDQRTLRAGEIVSARLPVDHRHLRPTAAGRDSRPRRNGDEQNRDRDEQPASGEHGEDSQDAPPGIRQRREPTAKPRSPQVQDRALPNGEALTCDVRLETGRCETGHGA